MIHIQLDDHVLVYNLIIHHHVIILILNIHIDDLHERYVNQLNHDHVHHNVIRFQLLHDNHMHFYLLSITNQYQYQYQYY